MKNILSNIPFVKPLWNFIVSVKYKLTNKGFRMGYDNSIKKGQFGDFVTLGDRISINNSKIGSYTYISYQSRINHSKIGKFCSVGPNCLIGPGKHPVDKYLSTHPLFYSNKKQVGFSILKESVYEEHEKIEIGNDVWIGASVIISDGVKVGDGAVIGAGSFVNKDVEPFSVVVGTPAKHLKYRFSSDKVQKIQKDPWWEKDISYIKNLVKGES